MAAIIITTIIIIKETMKWLENKVKEIFPKAERRDN